MKSEEKVAFLVLDDTNIHVQRNLCYQLTELDKLTTMAHSSYINITHRFTFALYLS
jgi:hypothetical protein